VRVAVDCHMVGSRRSGDAGNARYAHGLVHALAATAPAGHDVWALVAHPAAVAALPLGVCHAGVGGANVPRLTAGAARTLADIRADAAVFTYVAPLRTRARIALAVHDVSFMTHPEWLGPRAREVLRRLVPASARRAGAVLALSRTAAGEIVDALGVPAERVRVVSPAPEPVFHARPGADARVADRHGLRRYCLAVGDLGPRKNLATLAAAVRRLGNPDLRLALAGREARGSREVLGDARVTWLGRVDDESLADLYAAAAVTAFPSLHEGFGLPAVEALACGSPLVVSDRGALPEVVGDAAIVTAPTVEAVAEGLRAALEPGTAERLRDAGPERAALYSRARTGREAWAALGVTADPAAARTAAGGAP
jgi:glycosyltransferase involved in cell wall biosynthesis